MAGPYVKSKASKQFVKQYGAGFGRNRPSIWNRFFASRLQDIESLQTASGWNYQQARLLLKLHYDLRLIQSVFAWLWDRNLDIRAEAKAHAFDPTFISLYKITEADLKKIEGDRVRRYKRVFIRRRLCLPHDLEYYPDNNALPSLAPITPAREIAEGRAWEFARERVSIVEKEIAKDPRLLEKIRSWLAAGRPSKRQAFIKKLGIGGERFAILFGEAISKPCPEVTYQRSFRQVFFQGQYVRIPQKGEYFKRRLKRLELAAYLAEYGEPYIEEKSPYFCDYPDEEQPNSL